ncbi:hypothetical protein BBJ41_00880 [Burkholderia stabilis]|uniref:hypothetical protein n=1 Tax=Burkholderia TaxID=32008 RepID=UPI0008520F09|nr:MULTISPECIES: hypothetical protein [Burkholderia]AOR66220.1 hypothetical protein BBJ41_00880 [Burkholderia stabilis]MBR8042131.1 hypothetical protein [Burkholderia cenocepacia]HDR9491974.1 hypothetical protein [Burkholderia stabilis]HDR9523992.1 hypothetical protein [Burkholderia stabilis]HDR9530701.1 hypothetical protein [Burkholderia stabilis]
MNRSYEQEWGPLEWDIAPRVDNNGQDAETFIELLIHLGHLRDLTDEGTARRLTDEIRRKVRSSPYVSRHGRIELDHDQVRTLVINNPFRGQDGQHVMGNVRRIRWGLLLMNVLLGFGLAAHGEDIYTAIGQILNVFGTFDAALQKLDPEEAAVLTAAHMNPPPVPWQSWLNAANNLLVGWGVGHAMANRQELDACLAKLAGRGITVEYSGPNNDLIRIRHLVLLIQW